MPARSTGKSALALPLDRTLLKPGLRVAVAVSGGADSVALLRALIDQNTQKGRELGLVLHVAHLHHGLRGAEADADLEFCRELASSLRLPFHEARVDTAAEALANPQSGKPAESIEEAARRLRYSWFRQLISSGEVDAVATAHTFDDQAETVLAKFLRGAWTEGLAGISPKLESPEGGVILRPLLATTRAEIEAYLQALGQSWREDSSNRHLTFTRNRIRHELLPLLEAWNPQLRSHLVHMAELARDEEAWWQAELARLAPQFLLSGKPVRGGGRAGGNGLALDCTRLASLAPAMQRRLLRHAVRQLGGAEPDFAATEALRTLALNGRGGQKLELAAGLRAERTPRELHLSLEPAAVPGRGTSDTAPEYTAVIPGEILAPAFGVRLRIERTGPNSANRDPANPELSAPDQANPVVTLRNWKPGDRVRLRYTSSPRKVKEVLERLRITGSARRLWPVLESEGRILWMQGVELEPEPGLAIAAEPLP
ncbi:MAG TPA: tRNA lysidine(34) synthetase TilS [Terracidiphilus sp.]